MKKSKRLKVVQQLADMREREAAQLLGKIQQQQLQEKNKLQVLKDYQLEYQQRLSTLGSTSINIGTWKNYQSFMGNLDLAVQQQQGQLENIEQRLLQIKQYWSSTYAKHKNISRLIDDCKQSEALIDDKSLQKELDDRSQHRIVEL